ncbi:MAG: DUF502 domain-containing protein [Hyphomicrobiaceae bacterium]|nr:DUF502 domain-containing protein [Hyphomicrobiaceae bacterium]
MSGTNDEGSHPQDGEHASKRSAGARLRNYFLTGLIIVAPVAITAFLTWNFITWVDSLVKPLIPVIYNPDTYLPFPVPGVGLIAALFVITMLGFLAANLIGRTIIKAGEGILDRMPLIRSVYRALKQIFETALNDQSQTFQKVGLIQYPRPGLWAVVFVATTTKGEVSSKLKAERQEDFVTVFLPTTPNPTSGFLLFVPKPDVTLLDMSVEDGAKLVISAGLVSPEQLGVALPPGAAKAGAKA